MLASCLGSQSTKSNGRRSRLSLWYQCKSLRILVLRLTQLCMWAEVLWWSAPGWTGISRGIYCGVLYLHTVNSWSVYHDRKQSISTYKLQSGSSSCHSSQVYDSYPTIKSQSFVFGMSSAISIELSSGCLHSYSFVSHVCRLRPGCHQSELPVRIPGTGKTWRSGALPLDMILDLSISYGSRPIRGTVIDISRILLITWSQRTNSFPP